MSVWSTQIRSVQGGYWVIQIHSWYFYTIFICVQCIFWSFIVYLQNDTLWGGSSVQSRPVPVEARDITCCVSRKKNRRLYIDKHLEMQLMYGAPLMTYWKTAWSVFYYSGITHSGYPGLFLTVLSVLGIGCFKSPSSLHLSGVLKSS